MRHWIRKRPCQAPRFEGVSRLRNLPVPRGHRGCGTESKLLQSSARVTHGRHKRRERQEGFRTRETKPGIVWYEMSTFTLTNNTSPCEDKSLLRNELLVHMSPDFSDPGNQSEIQEIITNEFSSDELTAIVDSLECSNDFSPDCSTEGLKYLAGYIAHRCRKYDLSLVIPSGQSLTIRSHEKTWIEVLSKGGLLITTDE
ncbi:hypothetical protein AVEN_207043-1 [Araneus ventricosus]|uniref:Uncharacterized protein n=1 Tax=Araneus ventricosus TaxID=182803 RepID=A0A4Y2K2F7_ARAVE|nr:hypothetical protein AVEN_207043-1 [Araneus ventricosus]